MREWRKLHGVLIESDRLSLVSDGATVLYVFILARQDDAGNYPNTPAKLRALAVSRQWTYAVLTSYVQELVKVGLVSLDADGGFLSLRLGAEFNGPPRSGSASHRNPRYYPRTDQVSTPYPLEEKRREERRREESTPLVPLKGENTPKAKPIRQKPHLTEEELLALHSKYDLTLGVENVTEQVAAALDHKASLKRGLSGSWKSYVVNWLEKATSGLRFAGNGPAPRPPAAAPNGRAEEPADVGAAWRNYGRNPASHPEPR